MDDGRAYKLMSPGTHASHYREEVTPEFAAFVAAGHDLNAYISLCLAYVCSPQDWVLRPRDPGDLAHSPLADIVGDLYRTAPPLTCYRLTLENAIRQAVDVFNHYIASLLRRVFTERPETLRTENLSAKVALEYATREELIDYLADKKVTDLSHSGLPDIIAYLNRNLGLDFDTSMGYYIQACAFIELRNLIVHHGSRVTSRFIERTGAKSFRVAEIFPIRQARGGPQSPIVPPTRAQDITFKLGGTFPLSEDFVVNQLTVLPIVARGIDGRFINQFGLTTLSMT